MRNWKSHARPAVDLFRRTLPGGFYLAQYGNSSKRIASTAGERNRQFQAFLARHRDEHCLQIAVKDEIGHKFGPNWVSVDKYDNRDFIDRHDDVENLEFDDEEFSAAVCWSVLEHVPHPEKAIQELSRVLRPGGEIWVQVPFLYPYHESPHDYWRVTPDGLRMWLKDFDEVACACDYWARTKVVAATYFCGRKKSGPADA
jgi:SAM-dependent methyltransferase